MLASSNNLSHLHENHFEKKPSLELIDLSNNSIEFIHRHAFADAKSLKIVDLSNNRLTSDEFLPHLRTIKTLRLNQNEYTTLNITLLHDIDEVQLVGNFWQCPWLIPELVHQRLHNGIHFVADEAQSYEKQFNSVEEIDCYDQNRNNLTKKHLVLRHVIVVHSKGEKGCGFLDDEDVEVEQVS